MRAPSPRPGLRGSASIVSMPALVELAAGRIVELSCGADGAQASAVVSLVLALQARAEHVAWVAPRSAGLYPPDWARAGIDLDALLVVHVPDHDPSAGPRAAELLLRTGVMGAVVLDLSNARARVMRTGVMRTGPMRGRREDNMLRGEAWLGRLFGLAREHGGRLVLVSPHDHAAPSLGPLVSVRLAVRHASDEVGLVRDDEGRLAITTEVLKDKTGTLRPFLEDPLEEERAPATEAEPSAPVHDAHDAIAHTPWKQTA
ncbi:MAG: hypothetical protein K1X94_02630 [Sandaracinaceae bacterium]|nr:hypothetical protein [Sandaracinaceae bacterium]